MEINHSQILQHFSETLKTTYSAASEQAKEIKIKFEYALITLIFASLALSIQFSPSFGKEWKIVLIISWILLLFAGVTGGYRLMLIPEYVRLSGIQDYLSKRVQMTKILMDNPSFIQSVNAGFIIDPNDFKPNTLEGLKQGYTDDESKLATANKEINSLEKKLPFAFYLQIWSLLISYICLAAFTAQNYWCS